jgi:hypothetical protein
VSVTSNASPGAKVAGASSALTPSSTRRPASSGLAQAARRPARARAVERGRGGRMARCTPAGGPESRVAGPAFGALPGACTVAPPAPTPSRVRTAPPPPPPPSAPASPSRSAAPLRRRLRPTLPSPARRLRTPPRGSPRAQLRGQRGAGHPDAVPDAPGRQPVRHELPSPVGFTKVTPPRTRMRRPPRSPVRPRSPAALRAAAFAAASLPAAGPAGAQARDTGWAGMQPGRAPRWTWRAPGGRSR